MILLHNSEILTKYSQSKFSILKITIIYRLQQSTFFSSIMNPPIMKIFKGEGELGPPSYFNVIRPWKRRDIYGGN